MRIATCVLLFSLLGRSVDSQVSGRTPRVGSDSMVVHFNGVPDGTHVLSLKRTSTGYRYSEHLSLRPLMTREVVVDFDAAFRITCSNSQTTFGDQRFSSALKFRDGRARGYVFPLEGVPGKQVPVDTALPPGTIDGLALFPIILNGPWRIGLSDTVIVFDSDEVNITRQVLRVVAVEEVSVPAGRFRALRGELSTTQLPVTLWVTEARPHRLLKIASANGETVRAR
jgi:hypothetical protein